MKKQIATVVLSTLLLSGCASWCNEPCEVVTSKVVLPTSALFAFDSAKLTTADISALAPVVERLSNNPEENVKIQGHTDSTGPASYNLKLSERRAHSVASYLESKGVSATRITTKGFGEAKPVASNATSQGRAQNRRAEVITYK